MLTPDTVLQNRYRIVRLLGQGGMGAVYEAIDERLDTTVALKETLFTDERLRKQFEREARLLARMHHPALPRVSDHFAEGDGQFLVMQFIPGDDLSQTMSRKQGPFPPDQVLTWGDQLLDALDYLHTQDPQIIHRDIKPQNLKLTGRGQIILLDFGLAKGQGAGPSVVTTSASIFGYTPNYAPLEQIQGLGTDSRSDIYAVSATLYHLMTAVKPPDALTRAAALVNGQPDPLIPANEISNAIGPQVANVLTRGMSQNREQRYATAAAMREALKGSEEAATLVGRSEAATILHAPSAATLAETRGPVEKTTTSVRHGETTVVRPREKRRVAPWAIGLAALVLIGVLFGGFYAYQRRNRQVLAPVPSPTIEQAAMPVEQPSPSGDKASTSSSPATTAEQKKPTVNTAPLSTDLARKEKSKRGEAPKKEERAEEENPETPDEPGNDNNNTRVTPRVPEIVIPRFPERPIPNSGTRTLRNGTSITVLADGTRIVTGPNGIQRIIRPGGKLRRNRLP